MGTGASYGFWNYLYTYLRSLIKLDRLFFSALPVGLMKDMIERMKTACIGATGEDDEHAGSTQRGR
jgi:hypothetical protein